MISRRHRWLAVVGAATVLALHGSAAAGAVNADALHRGTGAGRRGRSLCPHHRRPHGQDARSHHHRREPAGRRRQHLGPGHDRGAGGRHADLGRHASAHRDQPQRLQQPALVDRRLPAADQGRASAARAGGASERSGRQFRGVRGLGQGQPRQADVFLVHGRHAVAPSWASCSTKSSISISPMFRIAVPDCR